MFSIIEHLSSHRALTLFGPLQVRKELRGYEEEDSALRVPQGSAPQPVSITGLAARRCPTGRDLYLEKRKNIKPSSWARYVLGKTIDPLLTGLYIRGLAALDELLEADPTGSLLTRSAVQAALQSAGAELIDELMAREVEDPHHKGLTIDQYADTIFGATARDEVDRTVRVLRAIVRHESRVAVRLVTRARGAPVVYFLRRALGTAPHRMAELRAALNMLGTEIHLDSKSKKAAVFGLSPGIRPDFVYGVIVVGDLKVDAYHPYYDLVAAGYAIFAEYAFGRRVNYALLMFVDVTLASPDDCEIKVVSVPVTNDRRVAWSAQRDSALRIVALPSVPPHPDDIQFCPGCPYKHECWIGGEIGKPQLLQ